jgi:2,5-diamino-6-(ribosylamino)-4(3H)-pyrimidinone 5'-phosphate reductase
VAHVAVSVDGATVGFAPDQARFYELARRFDEDVTLVGADTILAQETSLATAPRPGPAVAGPLLAVVDGRGRVREWVALREVGHWSDVLALHSAATPTRPPGHGVAELVTGTDRVDLAAVLSALAAEHGAAVVRVDSGGALIGALLDADLVDEVSLLVHPVLVGASAPRWYGAARRPLDALTLLHAEPAADGTAWLHYQR